MWVLVCKCKQCGYRLGAEVQLDVIAVCLADVRDHSRGGVRRMGLLYGPKANNDRVK